jgi:hypothetical protein
MKVLKKIGITILCLLLICGIGIVCLFPKEYSSLKSLKKSMLIQCIQWIIVRIMDWMNF